VSAVEFAVDLVTDPLGTLADFKDGFYNAIGAILDPLATLNAIAKAVQTATARDFGRVAGEIAVGVATGMAVRSVGRAVARAGARAGARASRCGGTGSGSTVGGSPGGGGSCFLAGTLIAAVCGFVPIEEIRIGDRIRSADGLDPVYSAELRDDRDTEAAFAAAHRVIELESLSGDLHVTLLRPLASDLVRNRRAGELVRLEIEEMGVSEWMRILAIEVPCFEERSVASPGEPAGQLVTGIFRRSVPETLRLDLGDEVLRTTRTHRFWSLTVGEWRSAGDLVAGEELLCADGGARTVRTVEELAGEQIVYNLEVPRRHYLVGREAGVVAHNGCGRLPSRGYDRPEVETKSGSAVRETEATDDWDDFLGPGQTDIDPRDGVPDPDRIWSEDGTRSIRYGDHEMNSTPNKHHYHRETWHADHVNNVLQRVQQPRSRP
jgi:hypothetical protein